MLAGRALLYGVNWLCDGMGDGRAYRRSVFHHCVCQVGEFINGGLLVHHQNTTQMRWKSTQPHGAQRVVADGRASQALKVP